MDSIDNGLLCRNFFVVVNNDWMMEGLAATDGSSITLFKSQDCYLVLTYLLNIDRTSSSLPRYQVRKNCFGLMKFEECLVFVNVMA